MRRRCERILRYYKYKGISFSSKQQWFIDGLKWRAHFPRPASGKADLEGVYELKHGYYESLWSCIHLLFFETCIQMDVDTGNNRKKWITLFTMYPHIMQMIVIEDPIVYSLRTCAVIVNLFILCCAARYWSIKADIPIRFGIDASAIRGVGTGIFAGTAVHFPTGWRTMPFAAVSVGVISPIDHPKTGRTQRGTILINR